MRKESFKISVYYDNWCPLCINVKEKIEKLDWLNLVEMVGIRGNNIESKIQVPEDNLLMSMHSRVHRNYRVVSGIDTFVSLSWRLPIFLPIWPLLKLSSILGFGGSIYQYVANKRSIVPLGKCDESCKKK
ncbi:DUF393 domain-containing protein [Radiobacillus kanasensis]|uniref:thiol-disulfide oxidoreductase DCC family protein n=1 Tax=Radiobacillus kanasensis TaxID=2844358 RepID=UPI001E328A7C|nr:DCC1-like thiol-disulfide oxidoreductase family protein [Radiobacillus kanasensis]UFT99132.1 DUF393 domain-containing protein [Radiobacillus kanasensis]